MNGRQETAREDINIKLLIVESPAKATTINRYLGPDFHVLASYGHVRDLPSKDGAVDPDNDFAMIYELNEGSEKHVNSIVKAARKADAVYIDQIRKHGLYDEIWQAFVAILPVRTVGVMGDERTYENVIAVRAVESTDAMTADWADLGKELLGRLSNRIINEVRGVNRVVYDISTKPPATIEWE